MFRHPNYYKNLRKLARNSELHVRPQGSEACDTDQAISSRKTVDVGDSVRPGPGPKQQAIDETVPHCDIEEASSAKLTDPQAANDKHQAPRHKRQA